jgi:cellulose synthase (UDP-forming)
MTKNEKRDRMAFLKTSIPKPLIIVNALMAAVYFYIICFFFQEGNPYLFWLLIAGEVFHIWQIFCYLYTIWDTEHIAPFDSIFKPAVDVFITVCGEPKDIVKETLEAVMAMDYPNFKAFILNDGFVAKKDNWQDMEDLARELGATCITRKTPGGAKAGNINNGMAETNGEYVAIFDADHVPHKDFLEKMIGYCADPGVAFVQSPQYYKNHGLNFITQGAWEQQELFFGPICKGKNRLNSATMCGTNMVISRKAMNEVGGMCTDSIAEDFVTGLFMHERGWKSVYHPEVLAEGLAAEDFLSYYKQQYRWARGALDVIFHYNPLFSKISWKQKIQYLSSASFYISGGIIIMNAILPLLFLYFGIRPFEISTMVLAAIFIPYMFITLYTLQRSTNFSFTFQSLAFSMCGFTIHLSALFAAVTQRKSSFSVTSKRAIEGNFAQLVIPHIAYVVLFVGGVFYAYHRVGLSASMLNNAAWALLNVVIFSQFIIAAIPFLKHSFSSDSNMPKELESIA